MMTSHDILLILWATVAAAAVLALCAAAMVVGSEPREGGHRE